MGGERHHAFFVLVGKKLEEGSDGMFAVKMYGTTTGGADLQRAGLGEFDREVVDLIACDRGKEVETASQLFYVIREDILMCVVGKASAEGSAVEVSTDILFAYGNVGLRQSFVLLMKNCWGVL